MSSFEVAIHTADSGMPVDIAEQVSTLFAINYPPSHSDLNWSRDFMSMLDSASVNRTIAEGSTYYVASADSIVAGFIKSRTVNRPDGTYEQLNWIMTTVEQRGSRVASLLHQAFITDAAVRALERAPKPTQALLSVHEDNPAQAIYQHWGYRVIERTDESKLLMVMDLPAGNPVAVQAESS